MATTSGGAITLDKPRTLRYTINALAAMERLTGQSTGDLLANVRGLHLADLRAVLWAGLLHEEKTLTVERVGELLDDYLHGEGHYLRDIYDAADAALLDHGFLRVRPAAAGAEGNA